MELSELRSNLNAIDDEIVSLFVRRMETVKQVSECKAGMSKAVKDKNREREILARVTGLAGEELESYTKVLFTTLMSLSRSYQHALSSPGSGERKLLEAMEATPALFPKKAVVACQGVEGAYSQQACDKLFSLPSIMYFSDFNSVFTAVEKGLCRYGVLPIENSTHGSVYETYDLMRRHSFYIVRSLRLKIDHALLTKPGVPLDKIKTVISHPQALGQCSEYLASLSGVTAQPVSNTAVAAQMVARSEDEGIACISSHNCADTYGLQAHDIKVANSDSNYTRFICIARQAEIYPGADRISLMLNLPHEPGALYELLSRFAALDINVRKLESRPIPGSDFEFTFYFDMEANLRAPEVRRLISELERENPSLAFLGSYSES
ncbi:MAG: bifunctional chorismate mutase/prephenate dehydratase [Candidatus Heteroscillospira sp.]